MSEFAEPMLPTSTSLAGETSTRKNMRGEMIQGRGSAQAGPTDDELTEGLGGAVVLQVGGPNEAIVADAQPLDLGADLSSASGIAPVLSIQEEPEREARGCGPPSLKLSLF